MYVRVGVEQILGLEGLCTASGVGALEASNLRICNAVNAHAINGAGETCWRGAGLISARGFCGAAAVIVGGGCRIWWTFGC